MYNFDTKEFVEKKKCKGIKKCHVKKRITFDDFKKCLFENYTHYVEDIQSFRSKKLHLQTISQKKKAFDNKDNKRVYNENSFVTYAHGHYKTLKN